MTERLYITVYRDERGTRATVSDTRTQRELSLPAFFLGELLRGHLARELIQQLASVQRAWLRDWGRVSTWVESPTDTADWITEETAEHLSRKGPRAPGTARRTSFIQWTGTRIEEIYGERMRLDQLRRCTEFGLHHWVERPYSQQLVCSICSASYGRLKLSASSAARVARRVIWSPVWKIGNKNYYSEVHEPNLSRARLPLRLLVDVETLENLAGDELSSLQYLLATSKPPLLELVGLPNETAHLPGVRPLEFGTHIDADGETHRHVIIRDFELPQSRDLGNVHELHVLSDELGGKDHGARRAILMAAARVTSHALVSTDEVLLRRQGHAREVTVLTPRQAAILAGIRFRYADRVPIPESLQIRAQHFSQARAVAHVPDLVEALASLIAGATQGLWSERAIRLFWGCFSRLALLAEAEDQMAFLWYFPQERSSADDDSAYHLEFFLMVAQALLDVLKSLAGERYALPKRQIIRWRSFLDRMKELNEDLYRFLTSPAGKAVRQIVRALRRPLAHSEHWWGTSHEGGSEDPTLVAQIVPGEPAHVLPRSIVSMREQPQDWGVAAWVYDVNDPKIKLQGYPFALNLNVRLLWFMREFLNRLDLSAKLNPDDIRDARPAPEQMTNPRLDALTLDVVRTLTWPLPD